MLKSTCTRFRGIVKNVIMSNVALIVGGIPAPHVTARRRLSAVSVGALNPDRDCVSLMVTIALIRRSFTVIIEQKVRERVVKRGGMEERTYIQG